MHSSSHNLLKENGTEQSKRPRAAQRFDALASLCQSYDIQILYAFGSRGLEAWEWVHGKRAALSMEPRDLDIGVKPFPGAAFPVRRKVELALALEDLFKGVRVDLVFLPDADPFLAANIIRGERLYAADEHAADEYDLYILRRAGDCAHLERERLALILDYEP